MQILFLFLFGGVVCFILYLSYDKYIADKKRINDVDNDDNKLGVDLNKYSDVIDTKEVSKEKIPEKVEKEEVREEIVKFKARRDNQNKKIEEEEII